MSWAEVYKINSDIQGEPLNYLNYLQDLKLNGSESYLLYEGNHRIWEELYLNSLYLFSDRGIREVVYTAFSETDIDNLFDKSTKLGEQLNAFYRTDIFSLGNADNVVKGMTVEHYNSLEEKFKAGYDRYVTREQEKSTIGAWFNSTFSLNSTDLESLTTIDEILADTEATNAILNNSNAIVALTMCKTSMDAVVASSNAMDLLGQYILKVTAEPAVIKAILENNVIREAIINSIEAMTHISTNHESVRMIFENLEATQLLLANQDTLDLVLANTNVIRLVLTKILETHNSIFKLDINTLITNMTSMVNSTNIEYQDKIFPIVENMNTNFISIKDLLSNNNLDKNNIIAIFQCIENNLSVITALSSDELAFNSIKEIDLAIAKTAAKLAGIDNININTSDALARSDKYMNAVASSQIAMNAVASSQIAMNAVASSQIAMNAVASSQIAMNAVASSQIAVNTIINNSGFLNIVISSSTAMSAIASSSTAMSAIASSSTAMSAIASSSTAMSAIASSSTAILAISKSRVNLQAFNKAIWDNRLDSKLETTLLNSSSFTRTFNYQSDSWIKSNTGTNVGAYSQGDVITKPNKIFILKYTTNSDNGTITINADGFIQTGTDGNGSGSPGTFPGIVSHYDSELTCYRRVYFGKVNVQISTTGDYYYGDIFTAK
ncbi:phage tail protein [Clostridioides difficile]|uniref:phage tail protein n=1 Tax=Clostridioides difficile TaxID=1496 RepID=UPI00115D24B9|nr:phage tail protein [Clostridioides difficile]MBG0116132.1 phage tail protein [Clostridioides difficile]MBH7286789.1 phage tail protein [Clostridioides difficile]MBH7401558.1 phage tail protein [Clostridioides difficile]MBN6019482.1 phage tail protein [Clostridioides difficile]MBY1439654.1 phage tail protein [Clostridioides difficile]